eukprot:TRINITY_DN2605_c0_g1_i1.p1 TRINITY_DN2605_c0_g1~~TRINITY_DN2605_c0_g1_i1.p1  ORF type:complete len:201 (+),score=47.09 TRINITY_DN2605_c0_g1_i1:58-603(+)
MAEVKVSNAVQFWYYKETDEDQRLPHKYDDDHPTPTEEDLNALGVEIISGLTVEELEELKGERGYSYSDIITVSPDTLAGYDDKIKSFFEEHLHDDDEIRYCADGSGYFDVRDLEDRWIRIFLTPQNLITLPRGIYHRFTLDSNDYIKAYRLFRGDPVWTPINRPADEHQARLDYVSTLDQ